MIEISLRLISIVFNVIAIIYLYYGIAARREGDHNSSYRRLLLSIIFLSLSHLIASNSITDLLDYLL